MGGLDALRESFPDMPREDRQLLMLRFVREVDQSVDYGEVRYRTIIIIIIIIIIITITSPIVTRTLSSRASLREAWHDTGSTF